MPAFHISGPSTVLRALVAAFLRELHPGATITMAAHSDRPPGIRVGLEGGDRWLCLVVGKSGTAEARAAGATAVVPLDASPEELALAVGTLLSGDEGLVPVSTLRWIAGAGGPPELSGAVALTAREREILQLVARGYSNNEIAAALTISTNTVRTHLHTLSVKLEATSRTRMLANARALAIPEAFAADTPRARAVARASA